jgi:PAS domain S-box-containing protein
LVWGDALRLVIADDHEIVRRGVRALLLTQPGWEVCAEAVDGYEAVEKAKLLSPDVVILDVSMPGMNGLEATRILRRISPLSEVLILSQHESAEMVRQAFSAGARGYVVKSSVGRDLITAVEKVSQHKIFYDTKIGQIEDWTDPTDVHAVLERGAALEKALRESEERYRALVTATSEAIWRTDPDGNVIWVSPYWTELTGGEFQTPNPPRWSEVVHPDDQAKAQTAFGESIRSGTPYHCEFRVRIKDGSYRYFSAKSVPVRNPDNSIREWMGTLVDFTERKHAEVALRESEAHLRLAQAAGKLGTWEWDFTTNTSHLSAELNEMFGFDEPLENTFEAWSQRLHADDLVKTLSLMQEGRESGVIDLEYRYHHPTRGLRWYYCKGAKVGPDDNRLFGILLDITDRKRTERTLREREAHLRLAQAAAGVGTWEYDAQSDVRKNWSAETYQIFGIAPESADFHKQWLARVHPDDLPNVKSTLRGANDTTMVEVEYRYEHPTLGERWMYSKGRLLAREGGDTTVFGISMDITARKRAEEDLRREREGLEDLVEQRTSSLRRLSARLLHLQDTERRRIARELHDSVGQELVALKIHLEALKKPKGNRLSIVDECQNAVDACLAEIRTLSHLLHPPLLDEAGLASAVTWYVEGFSARSGIRVALELPESLTRLSNFAETALFRVLQESLTNIHRHSGSRSATVRFEVLSDSVRLTVTDNGKGISPHVLERFRNAGTEVGVGLAGMRERIAELGGRLEIHSGSGTTVTATIPLSKSPDHEEEAAVSRVGI